MRTDAHYALVDLVEAKIVRTYDADQGPYVRKLADRLDGNHEWSRAPAPIRYIAAHIPAVEQQSR